MTDSILNRYEQAQSLMQGVMSKRLVLNDAVFPHWIEDSDCFWYEREVSGDKVSSTALGREYRLVDAKAVSNTQAFDHQALVSALEEASGQTIDPQSLPILVADIILSPRQVRFTAFDKQWMFESDKTSCQEIKATNQIDGLHAPDGQKVAFVRDHNLWVRNLTNGKERALTEDGSINCPYATAAAPFGTPSTTALQAVWSPDSQRLFTHQLDVRQVASRPMIRHVPQDGSIRPQLKEFKAACTGSKHRETYQLVVINVTTGNTQTVKDGYLTLCRNGAGFFSDETLGWWANDSRRAFFVDVDRGAKTVRLVEFDSVTGDTRVLFEESSDTFVKLSHGLFDPPLLLPLPGSDELIWFSERSGWGHLYLYDLKTGNLKYSLTEGEWLVRDILQIDIGRRELLVQTAARDPAISPYYRDICRINLDTAKLTPLVSGDYDYVVFNRTDSPVRIRGIFNLDSPDVCGISPRGNYLVTTYSRVDKLPVSLLINRNGKEILTLETTTPAGLPVDWQWPEPVKLTAADGKTDLYGVVYRPPGFSPEKRYPVLDFSCGHPGFSYIPHAAFISGAFNGSPYLQGAAYAALGFIVVAIEGRGTPYRYKAFQDASYGSMTSANAFDDRIAGLRQLAKHYPYMDLHRVGIVGCDGITAPVYGLLEHPEFYKVGVMVALGDSRFEPAALVEMFEGVNQIPKADYAEELVSQLQGKLLLIHGMLDTITRPEATLRLIDALQHANKDFDMLLLPNDGHDISSYALRRTWDYLVTHLLELGPPKAFKLTTGYDLLKENTNK